MTKRIDADRGLLYAEACFETFRVHGGCVFRLGHHLNRLARALGEFGIQPPPGLHAEIKRKVSSHQDAICRVTVTGGVHPFPLFVPSPRPGRTFIHFREATPSVGLSLRSCPWPFPLHPRTGKFTADYAQTLRAVLKLRRSGHMQEGETAIVCAQDALVSLSHGNLLLKLGGEWVTPDSPFALAGIVRDALIEANVVKLAPLTIADLDTCEAAAMCNSGVFVLPATYINGRPLSTEEFHFAPLWEALEGLPGVPPLKHA